MSTRTDGSLRGELTMRKAWDTADVGERGSLCIKLYVKADPESQAPEYLVCATPPREAGETLVGQVLRNERQRAPAHRRRGGRRPAERRARSTSASTPR